ncbi:MAG: hypothetical protein J2P48_22650 [Alphaproteobacteria bacterium]|nr:hypothetical protein [Alphaproteobacteria bacterium]
MYGSINLLAHKLYAGMGHEHRLWPIESFQDLQTIIEGKLAMESEDELEGGALRDPSRRAAISARPACR